MDERVQERMAALERRLEDYHARLEAAVEERDLLAIDAAWGSACAMTGIVCAAAAGAFAFFLFGIGLDLRGAASEAAAVIAAVIAYFAGFAMADRMRRKEKAALARLPAWSAGDGQGQSELA